MKKYFTLFILLFVFLFPAVLFAQAVNTQDSLALVALYHQTGGKQWRHKQNWLSTAPVSSWYGITVSGGRVTAVDLSFNSLKGSLKNNAMNLPELTSLNLGADSLAGEIPAGIKNLVKLTSLNLALNQFTGNIPASIGNLTNLQTLALQVNSFTSGSIPASFASLTSLTTLDLSTDSLKGNIPSSLGNLTNLQYLNLYFNNLSGAIPASLGNLTALTLLDLRNNNLTGSIPASFGNLVNMRDLKLSHNDFGGAIVDSLNNIPAVSYVFLDNNAFTFSPLEAVFAKFATVTYNPQANIPLVVNGNQLSVSVGGTQSKVTYTWYKDGAVAATNIGDSTFTATGSGVYKVKVKDKILHYLTLTSKPVTIGAVLKNIQTTSAGNTLISIYPNPADNMITVDLNKVSNANALQITNAQGIVILNRSIEKNNTTQIDVSRFAAGVYFINVKTADGKTMSERFIKK